MSNLVTRFRAVEFLAGARQILIAAPDRSLVLLKLLLEFGNFQHREKLPLFHVRTPIHVQLLDVAGHLGVNINLLEGLKLGGNFECAGKIVPRHSDYGDARSIRRIVGAGLVRLSATGNCYGYEKQRGKSPRGPMASVPFRS